MWLLGFCQRLPGAVWRQHAPVAWTFVPALAGTLWVLLPKGVPLRWLGLVGFMPMLMITHSRPDLGDMKVTVLDVGQGLSVYVQTASHNLLYDAGPKYSASSDAGKKVIVPFLRASGATTLDGFIVSHDDADHSGGMQSILSAIPVAWLAHPKPGSTATNNNRTVRCAAGQYWRWDGVVFEMLSPDGALENDASLSDNNRSCVLKIMAAAGSLLLPGDIEKIAEDRLLEEVLVAKKLNSDILVAPHHGSKTSSSWPFIQAVSPNWVIFTSGYLNRSRHPAAEVVQRYRQSGSKTVTSATDGAVIIDFSGQPLPGNIRVHSYRKQYERYWH